MPEDKKAIVECYRENRVSKKNGTVYQVLNLVFENGYKTDMFLSDEQRFIIGSIVPCIN